MGEQFAGGGLTHLQGHMADQEPDQDAQAHGRYECQWRKAEDRHREPQPQLGKDETLPHGDGHGQDDGEESNESDFHG